MASCDSVGASSACSADFQAWVWTSIATRFSRFISGEHACEDFAVDVSAGEHRGDLAPGEPAALLADGCERRSTGTLGAVVGALKQDRDRLRDLVVADLDDPVDMPPHDFPRFGLGRAAWPAVGPPRPHFHFDRLM